MKNNSFLFGLQKSIPIGIGYAPVALTFGILSLKSGLSIWQAGFMSLFVFAGASQFIAVQLISQGATIWVIAITTLIVNIRHILMSFSMLRFFSGIPMSKLAFIAQGITDESFVLSAKLLEEIPTPEERSRVAIGVNLGAFCSWVVFTFIGAWMGNQLTINFSGFNFALLALFIVLTVGTVSRENILTYVIAGVLAVILKYLIPGKMYLLLSVGLAAAIGAWLKHHGKTAVGGE
ncbi:MAG: AzlC family ABC transporter permease [Peptococcaceae bacterium]|nr:AzlC family ABC transporter permease [Peptococcaceae bacterium]